MSLTLLSAFAACTSGLVPSGSAGAASAGGTGGKKVAGNFGDGLCGKCFEKACGEPIAACEGDPGCTKYLGCLRACPTTTAEGSVEPGCADGCAEGVGAKTKEAIDALTICRSSGPGRSSCVACGALDVPDAEAGEWDWITQQMCPPSTDPNPCYKCEETHCCETYKQYSADQAAKAYFQCYLDCGNAADSTVGCAESCAEQEPDGLKNFAPRLTCLQLFCFDNDACGAAPLDPCLKCAYEKCTLEYANSKADPEGFLLSDCAAQCNPKDTSCWDACSYKYPKAGHLFDTFNACAATSGCPVCNDP